MKRGLMRHNRRSPFGAAAPPTPTGYWITTLNGVLATPINIFGTGIGVDSSGNSYSAGYYGTPTEHYSILSKYDLNGAIQWQKAATTPSTFQSQAKGLNGIVDSSGNVYVVGTCQGQGASGIFDAFIIKYNSSGAIQWQRELEDPSFFAPYDQKYINASFDPSGNIHCIGSTATPSDNAWWDILYAKYNSSGTIQAQGILGDTSYSSSNEGYAICSDPSGNYFIGGYTEKNSAATADDGLIAKFDSSNALIWQKGFYSPGYRAACYIYGVVSDSLGNIYAAGYVQLGDTYVGIVMKLDTNGAIVWQRYFGIEDGVGFYAIAIDSSNYLYVTGYGSTFGYIVKYNSSGAIQWQRKMSTTGSDVFTSIFVDSSGNYYVTGTDNTNDVTFKLPTDGSRTGTYGGYTYAASNLTDSSGDLTSYSSALSYGAAAFSALTGNLTPSTPTFTTTVTIV